MGVYLEKNVVMYTRRALGYTQQQISEGICAENTFSRYEHGKQHLKRENYVRIMERMYREGRKSYSVISLTEVSILKKKKCLENYILQRQYKKAEEVLEELENAAQPHKYHQQYVERTRALLEKRLHKSTSEEYLEKLKQALNRSIPKEKVKSMKEWPYTYTEAQLMLNISSAYGLVGKYEESIEVLEELLQSFSHGYIDAQQRYLMEVTCQANLARRLVDMEKYDQAEKMAKRALETCYKSGIGSILPDLYMILLSVYETQPKEKQDVKKELELLRKAYYISCAMNHKIALELIEKHWLKKYHGLGLVPLISES